MNSNIQGSRKTRFMRPYFFQIARLQPLFGSVVKPAADMAAIAVLSLATGFIAQAAHAANLLYKTDFGSDVALSPPHIVSDGRGAIQDLVVTGKANGSLEPTGPWASAKLIFQLIADAPITDSTLSDYITNEIQQVTGPSGTPVNAVFQNLKQNTAAGPAWGTSQDAFILFRESVAEGDKTDTGDVYYSYWFKFQPDLHSQVGVTDNDSWRVMSSFKTGGLNNTYEGDYRVSTIISQDSNGKLTWRTGADNVANGMPNVEVYWKEPIPDVPVPVGEWFKYEVFWHRSSGGDGRYWTAVNGQVIADHRGPNMGVYNLPINRIMLTNNYGGGKVPSQQWLTALEIWDGFPCGEGKSCYGR